MQIDLFGWLSSPAFAWGATQLSIAEVLGFVTGLWCVWLAARENIWNFPFGIANCALLLLLFFHVRLYADAALQLLFIGLNIRGWMLWSKGDQKKPDLAVSTGDRRLLIVAALVAILLWAAFVPLLRKAGGSLPMFDALITSLSVIAQYLLNRKILQSWWWWIAVDVISIPVYAYKDLYLIALLYCVFLALCVFGYRAWSQELRAQQDGGQLSLA
jgi:nicotinamide mononucleotide transporter